MVCQVLGTNMLDMARPVRAQIVYRECTNTTS